MVEKWYFSCPENILDALKSGKFVCDGEVEVYSSLSFAKFNKGIWDTHMVVLDGSKAPVNQVSGDMGILVCNPFKAEWIVSIDKIEK